MIVVAPLVAVAVLAGWLAAAAVGRWPQADPSAPKIVPTAPRTETVIRRHPGLRALLRRRLDPTALTGLALTAAVGLLVLAVAGTGLLLVMARHDAGLARFDTRFARWGGDHATDASTRVLKLVSLLGGTAGVVAVALVTFASQVRRPRRGTTAAFLILVVAGQFAVVALIKGWVDRDRPAIHQLTGFSGSSFPSGHAAAATATYAAVALVLGRFGSRAERRALTGVAAGIAAAVAGTRVLLGVHWFTDVLAGMAVGYAWFALCSVAFGGRLLSFGAPVEAAEDAVERAGAVPSRRPGIDPSPAG